MKATVRRDLRDNEHIKVKCRFCDEKVGIYKDRVNVLWQDLFCPYCGFYLCDNPWYPLDKIIKCHEHNHRMLEERKCGKN